MARVVQIKWHQTSKLLTLQEKMGKAGDKTPPPLWRLSGIFYNIPPPLRHLPGIFYGISPPLRHLLCDYGGWGFYRGKRPRFSAVKTRRRKKFLLFFMKKGAPKGAFYSIEPHNPNRYVHPAPPVFERGKPRVNRGAR
jgi:hypothetical protein